MRLLALDTATEGCSAALLMGEAVQARSMESERGHAERILPMIDELLAEAGITLHALDGIAFGRGPGSFTGVRLAASVTQGLAFGAGLPVVPVSDLQAVAQQVAARQPCPTSALRVLVCNDARMQELYWGCFQSAAGGLMVAVGSEQVGKPGTVSVPEEWVTFAAAGRGFAAYAGLAERLGPQLSMLDSRMLPNAAQIVVIGAAALRAGAGLPPEQALPVYLRDNVARPQP